MSETFETKDLEKYMAYLFIEDQNLSYLFMAIYKYILVWKTNEN